MAVRLFLLGGGGGVPIQPPTEADPSVACVQAEAGAGSGSSDDEDFVAGAGSGSDSMEYSDGGGSDFSDFSGDEAPKKEKVGAP